MKSVLRRVQWTGVTARLGIILNLKSLFQLHNGPTANFDAVHLFAMCGAISCTHSRFLIATSGISHLADIHTLHLTDIQTLHLTDIHTPSPTGEVTQGTDTPGSVVPLAMFDVSMSEAALR